VNKRKTKNNETKTTSKPGARRGKGSGIVGKKISIKTRYGKKI
jgi:hypothetical protein